MMTASSPVTQRIRDIFFILGLFQIRRIPLMYNSTRQIPVATPKIWNAKPHFAL